MSTETTPQTGPHTAEELASSTVSATETNHRIARLVASVAGLLGVLLAIATPLLPVDQTTAQLNWPQNGTFGSVEAPLIGYVATDLNITVPCQAAPGPSHSTSFASAGPQSGPGFIPERPGGRGWGGHDGRGHGNWGHGGWGHGGWVHGPGYWKPQHWWNWWW